MWNVVAQPSPLLRAARGVNSRALESSFDPFTWTSMVEARTLPRPQPITTSTEDP